MAIDHGLLRFSNDRATGLGKGTFLLERGIVDHSLVG